MGQSRSVLANLIYFILYCIFQQFVYCLLIFCRCCTSEQLIWMLKNGIRKEIVFLNVLVAFVKYELKKVYLLGSFYSAVLFFFLSLLTIHISEVLTSSLSPSRSFWIPVLSHSLDLLNSYCCCWTFTFTSLKGNHVPKKARRERK